MPTQDLLLLNQAQIMDRTAHKFADQEAIAFKDRVLTWRELREQSFKMAKAFLQAGIKKGDRVGIMMTNIPEWVVARNAINCVGAWLVPINTRYKTSELKKILSMGEVNALVMMDKAVGIDFVELMHAVCPGLAHCPPGQVNLPDLPFLKTVICLGQRDYPGMYRYEEFLDSGRTLDDETVYAVMAAVSPHDVSTLLFTSGTTGVPKGVLTTHYQFTRVFGKFGERFGVQQDDVLLGGTPFFTNFGLCTVLIFSELTGAKIAIFETFDPEEILAGIERHGISVFCGTPAMYTMLLHHPHFNSDKVRSMRVGDIGGAPFMPAQVREIMDKFGMTLFAAYGMTENTGVTTVSVVGDAPELVAYTVGTKFNDECEIKIVDVVSRQTLPPGQQGEILTRGWNVTQGFYNNPEGFAKAKDPEGWFLTGDLGVVDENGYYKITGRLKDLIVSGGLNIDPVEIENFLMEHPSVGAAYVVGLPDWRMGEVVGTFIQLKDGQACTAQEITAFCEGKIGKYKIPKYVQFITDVPRTAVGKVQKFQLRELGLQMFNLADTDAPGRKTDCIHAGS
ncbi:MAG: AMP-binding protein [Desulfuromonadaceae bacterium]